MVTTRSRSTRRSVRTPNERPQKRASSTNRSQSKGEKKVKKSTDENSSPKGKNYVRKTSRRKKTLFGSSRRRRRSRTAKSTKSKEKKSTQQSEKDKKGKKVKNALKVQAQKNESLTENAALTLMDLSNEGKFDPLTVQVLHIHRCEFFIM